jgi:hypothetical protein
MADKLLSQADIDALVSSLSSNKTALKPASAAPPVSVPPAPQKSAPPATRPPAASTPAAPAAVNKPRPAAVVAPDNNNLINSKLADMAKQIAQLSAIVKRVESLEDRIAGLEARIASENESSEVNQKVQQLAEELKRISQNLQNTPGYGIRNSFKCEKCHEPGHVATMFRCTQCGHESWRGWWPQK